MEENVELTVGFSYKREHFQLLTVKILLLANLCQAL